MAGSSAVAVLVVVVLCTALQASADTKTQKDLKAMVRHENGRTWIEGVERLGWGKGMDCTYMGVLTALAHYLGDDVSYDYLMGVSGMAFRVQKWAKAE